MPVLAKGESSKAYYSKVPRALPVGIYLISANLFLARLASLESGCSSITFFR